MPTKQQAELHPDQKNQDSQQLKDVIGRLVTNALGRPDDLLRVQVRQLWDDHYRVNIVVGMNVASARVAHSYFLVTDGDGNIIESVPKITKQY